MSFSKFHVSLKENVFFENGEELEEVVTQLKSSKSALNALKTFKYD